MGSPGKNPGVGCHVLLQGSSRPRDGTQVSLKLAAGFFTTEPPGKPPSISARVNSWMPSPAPHSWPNHPLPWFHSTSRHSITARVRTGILYLFVNQLMSICLSVSPKGSALDSPAPRTAPCTRPPCPCVIRARCPVSQSVDPGGYLNTLASVYISAPRWHLPHVKRYIAWSRGKSEMETSPGEAPFGEFITGQTVNADILNNITVNGREPMVFSPPGTTLPFPPWI